MTPEPVKPADTLIESAAEAFRERNAAGQVLPSAAWFDLSPEDRERLFEAQIAGRAMERTIDAEGLSGTARAVLTRLRRTRAKAPAPPTDSW